MLVKRHSESHYEYAFVYIVCSQVDPVMDWLVQGGQNKMNNEQIKIIFKKIKFSGMNTNLLPVFYTEIISREN